MDTERQQGGGGGGSLTRAVSVRGRGSAVDGVGEVGGQAAIVHLWVGEEGIPFLHRGQEPRVRAEDPQGV